MISQVLELGDNTNQLIRYLKLEATWILIHLSFGQECHEKIFDPKYQIINHLNLILKGNDIQMIDQAIWICANMAAESQELKK